MITENNYEEYFLLYTDNELSDAERSDVETFVQQHPQYAAELEALLQTKLNIDEEVSFADRNVLYRSDANEIGIDNFEEYFLLYTDRELTEEEKASTERFVLQHPQLQREFMLLQQTKLPVENIEFPNKESLYKKEKTRRVLPLYVTRLSIAAAVVMAIASMWLMYKPDANETIVAGRQTTEKKPLVAKQDQPVALPQKLIKSTEETAAAQTQQKAVEVADNNTSTLVKRADKEDKQKPVVVLTLSAPEQDAPAQQEENPVVDQNNAVAANTHQATATLKPLELVNEEELNAQTALLVSDNNNTAKSAAYKELDTDDDNHTLYVGSLQINKAKVNGILKSASRLLGGKSKQNMQ